MFYGLFPWRESKCFMVCFPGGKANVLWFVSLAGKQTLYTFFPGGKANFIWFVSLAGKQTTYAFFPGGKADILLSI